jgi:uncharacterized protein (TIGR03083 family)
MQFGRYLDCLAADFARLRSVARIDQSAAVPTCPAWSVADLTGHVAEVYLHKAAAIRDGVEPQEWPPKQLALEEPLALLERAYAELSHEFATRQPSDQAGSWYTPDQTVGFWMRRMAHETVIHRIDAELATGQSLASIPADLALDGVDELLKVFVAFGVANWGRYFTEILSASPGRTYRVRADAATWRVRTGPGVFEVQDGPSDSPTDVSVSAAPTDMLRWVWNREAISAPSGVSVQGSDEAVAELKRCIAAATQ